MDEKKEFTEGRYMDIIFGIILYAEMFLLGFCTWRARTASKKAGRIVYYYSGLSFVCSIFFAIYTYVPQLAIKNFSKGITLICFDWLLILLMLYTEYYTCLFKGIRAIKYITYVYAMIDSVSLFANTWTHHIFEYQYVDNAERAMRIVHNYYLFDLHFIVNYLFMIMVILSYLIMILRSSKFYRFRYEVVFIVIFVGFILDLSSMYSHFLYNISMLAFGCMSILIYYFTLEYVPNMLIENTMSLVIKDMNNGIVCFDNSGKCIYTNELIQKLYDTDGNVEILEQKYHKWLHTTDQVKDAMQFRFSVKKEEAEKTYEVTYKRIYDDKQNWICDCFIFNDRTEEIASLEYEKYRASHDSMTGLLNKEQFYQDVYELLHQNPDKKYCLVCSNIKDFKFVNELFGMEKGDTVLLRQAELMREYTPKGTLLARMQNDRFAMCIPRKDLRENVVHEVIFKLQEETQNSAFRMHIFVGVYDIINIEEPISIMCDKANLASTTIENDYHSDIAFYSKNLFDRSIEERRIIGEFEGALNRKEFVMFLQPQVNAKGELYGAEALVRWQHAQRGLLSPAMFIDVLEKAGLIYKLDRYIWESAAQKLKEWKDKGAEQYHISVNISTKDFYFVDIYEIFTGLIEKYDIRPDRLNLEITETALMSDFDKNMEILKQLQEYGFKIEIDDFGSGYSSLNMLKDISADVLKIDMGFLRASENEAKGMDILESIIVLAGKLGMDVITEGVEMEKQLTMLSNMGCGIFQGYYFSKPIPTNEFEDKYHIF